MWHHMFHSNYRPACSITSSAENRQKMHIIIMPSEVLAADENFYFELKQTCLLNCPTCLVVIYYQADTGQMLLI
jgi:hypothetical protein